MDRSPRRSRGHAACADPTTIQNPGPGDGLALLLYLPEMVLSFLIYALIAIAIRRASKPTLR
jgi:hypothetical protein